MKKILLGLVIATYTVLAASYGIYTDTQINQAKNSTDPKIVEARNDIIALANTQLGKTSQAGGLYYILHEYIGDSYNSEAGAHNNAIWAKLTDNEYALQLAIAYHMTGNTKYADKAVYFLNSWSSSNTRCMGKAYVDYYGGEENLPVPDLGSYKTPGYYDQSGADSMMNQVMQGFIQAGLLLKDYDRWAQTDKDIFTTWINNSKDYYRRFFLPGEYQPGKWFNPEWPEGNGNTSGLIQKVLIEAWNEDTETLNGESKTYMKLLLDGAIRPLTYNGFNIPHMIPGEVLRGNNGMWYTSWGLEAFTQLAGIFENTIGVDFFHTKNVHGSSLVDALDKFYYYIRHVDEWPWLSGRESYPSRIKTGGTISRVPQAGSWGGTMYEALGLKLNRSTWSEWASSKGPTTFFATGRTSWCCPTLLPLSETSSEDLIKDSTAVSSSGKPFVMTKSGLK